MVVHSWSLIGKFCFELIAVLGVTWIRVTWLLVQACIIISVIYFIHNCVTCGRIQEMGDFLSWMEGCLVIWCLPILIVISKVLYLSLLILIYKLQPEISLVTGYRIAEFLHYQSSLVQLMCNSSIQKRSAFPFVNGLLFLDSNIGQSNFHYRFHLKWYTEWLARLECIYVIL